MSLQTSFFELSPDAVERVKKLKGPIFIFGAGGIVGLNLMHSLLLYREDVFGISQDPKNNWRFSATSTPSANLLSCDITQPEELRELLRQHKPQTIFNLAAYGAYSKQKEYRKIYKTNFIATVDMLEALRENGFSAFIHAGSSSEYGLNSAGPSESDELIPNSHYAVSKTAVHSAIKYFGKIEKLPILNLRLYSAYGPWEEPDRLMPVLVAHARNQMLPPLVNPAISRDFIYVTDISSAFVYAAAGLTPDLYGEVFNIGTGIKTTIGDITQVASEMFHIQSKPTFGEMPDRKWDVVDWYANIESIKKKLAWQPRIPLAEGLQKVASWQEEVGFDTAYWNWTSIGK